MISPHSIAYLGPPGTFSETAALCYLDLLGDGDLSRLHPYPTIAQALRALARREVGQAIVPVENSIEGSVTTTLDTVWSLEGLQVEQALVLPIVNTLLSRVEALSQIRWVYSHPQPLAQCQQWLEQNLPQAQLIPTRSTIEALTYLDQPATAAIAAERAAELYSLPILARELNDHPGNRTRFWVLSLQRSSETLQGRTHTSLAFSFSANAPGTLAQALSVFASRQINLSRIESRPTKRSLGEYLFFIDLEADAAEPRVCSALAELKPQVETLKVFGSYSVSTLESDLQDNPV